MAAERKTGDRVADYDIRWYEPGDEEAYLSLYETVFDSTFTPQWFDWRYRSPFLDSVPLVVATFGGELVGARSFLPFYVRGREQTRLALQPAGTMVHPDHRRMGVFSRLVEETFEHYADREPDLFYSFPSPSAKSANLGLGWREAGRIPLWHRVHRSMLGEEGVPRIARTFKKTRAALGEVTFRYRDRASKRAAEIAVERHDSVPADVLAALYERSVPDRLHVKRDREFYRWRYGNPQWTCTTYVAHRDESPVGAIVTGKRENYPKKAILMDSLPLTDASRDSRVFDRLLAAVIRDHLTTPILRAADSIAPTRLLWAYGFVRNDLPIISRFAHHREMVVRPFDADDATAWRLGGYRIDNVRNWIIAQGDTDAP